jgi:hypothetical protein
MPSEIEDEILWSDERIAAAKLELAAEEQRRAAAKEAAKAAELSPEAREAIAMKKLGEMPATDGRKEVLQKYGFDPGWGI